MKIEKAKEIQKLMTHVESMAETLLEHQIEAGAAIFRVVIADEKAGVKIEAELLVLITNEIEPRAVLEELE